MNPKEQFHPGHKRGAPPGNRNAWKHGWYSEDAIWSRRNLRAFLQESFDLMREMRDIDASKPEDVA